jgi:hypothetical protein
MLTFGKDISFYGVDIDNLQGVRLTPYQNRQLATCI